MKKEQRIEIWNKYDKHCAYCGKEIEYKDMQVDHITPKTMSHWYKSDGMKIVGNLKGDHVDDAENLNPSCRRCNHYKRSLTLEEFRNLWLAKLHERLMQQYTVRVAVDYGIVTLRPFDKKFYFEKL